VAGAPGQASRQPDCAVAKAANQIEIVIAKQSFELRDDGEVYTKIGDKIIS
jgi:hypothetical protein